MFFSSNLLLFFDRDWKLSYSAFTPLSPSPNQSQNFTLLFGFVSFHTMYKCKNQKKKKPKTVVDVHVMLTLHQTTFQAFFFSSVAFQ